MNRSQLEKSNIWSTTQIVWWIADAYWHHVVKTDPHILNGTVARWKSNDADFVLSTLRSLFEGIHDVSACKQSAR